MSFSWETRSAASETASVAPVSTAVGAARPSLTRAAAVAVRRVRPELLALVTVAGTLNLWALQRNGWANEYYSAAVRSMSSSWHNFLFASLDKTGVMSVDKPPLALWVQSLSVRLFGYQPLSVLVPEALMGVASVVLLYDLVRSRFGRVGGFVAGLALATTPITVGISRHNNPDALLVLCCVAALWFAVRGLKDGRLRWIVLAGVCVGLGFETKMGVALVVVPGIVAAWLWAAPRGRGRLHALRQLLGGGVAMVLVGGAWPALVELTPAADRPWISGTSDNRVLSLILEYNGVGRVDGQTGGPAGGGGSMFGGAPGPLRLLNSALGGQAGWLLGFALISGLGILVATRLRRSDPRSGWLIAVGGAFLTTAVLFSSASGIFHPYYVSLLAPFIAALVGAGAAQLLRGGLNARILGPLAIGVGVAVELAVRNRYPGELSWLPVVLITAAVLAGVALWAFDRPAGAGHRRGNRDRRASAGTVGVGGGHARIRDQRHLPRGRTGLGIDLGPRRRAIWRLRGGRWASEDRRCRRRAAVRARRRAACGPSGSRRRRAGRPAPRNLGRPTAGSVRSRAARRRGPLGLRRRGLRRWRGRGGGADRQRRLAERRARLRKAARRRHDRGRQPVERQPADRRSECGCRRNRRLLRTRERREPVVARAGGERRENPLGARGTGRRAGRRPTAAGRHAQRLEDRDGGRGEGLSGGEPADDQRRRLRCDERRERVRKGLRHEL